MHIPAGNTGTVAATGTTPHTATAAEGSHFVPSDFSQALRYTIAGNQHYSTGTIEEGPTTIYGTNCLMFDSSSYHSNDNHYGTNCLMFDDAFYDRGAAFVF